MTQFEGTDCQTRRCWLAYFDILGFANLLREQGELAAISAYETCVEEVRDHERRYPQLGYVYFSDTFLIYASDDSQASLAAIEQSARWFFNSLVSRRIPFRGALACGDFLADPKFDIYVGNVLIEASEMGEKYNWIGLVMAPSAVTRLAELGLPADERLNYKRWNIPFKVKGREEQETEPGIAYLIGATHPMNGGNQYISILTDMAKVIKNTTILRKYTNTLEFLNHFPIEQRIMNSEERNRMLGNQSS